MSDVVVGRRNSANRPARRCRGYDIVIFDLPHKIDFLLRISRIVLKGDHIIGFRMSICLKRNDISQVFRHRLGERIESNILDPGLRRNNRVCTGEQCINGIGIARRMMPGAVADEVEGDIDSESLSNNDSQLLDLDIIKSRSNLSLPIAGTWRLQGLDVYESCLNLLTTEI